MSVDLSSPRTCYHLCINGDNIRNNSDGSIIYRMNFEGRRDAPICN